MNPKKIIIAGGSGFIGAALAQEFYQRGFRVTILTRSLKERNDGVQEIKWDAKNLGAWASELEGAAAVINLTGKNINCPHTVENLNALTASRVDSVNVLALALSQIKVPPRVWIQASAIGFYGDAGDKICDENSPNGENALAKLCCAWETAFAAVDTGLVRKVTLRIGFVLGNNGGALPLLSKLTKWFLGGAVGDGRQFVSWIHLADLVQMFVLAVEQTSHSGAFNAVAPNAVTNAELMRELRNVWHRPWSPPVPKIAVRLGAKLIGSEPSLPLASQRCLPTRFMETGFPFQFPELSLALKNLCQTGQRRK